MGLLTLAATGEVKTVDFKIEGMTCNGCVKAVETEFNKIDGVKEFEVSPAKHVAVVSFESDKTSEQELHKAVQKAGFVVKDENAKTEKAKSGCCGDKAPCGDKKNTI